jgi:hypothetical protein
MNMDKHRSAARERAGIYVLMFCFLGAFVFVSGCTKQMPVPERVNPKAAPGLGFFSFKSTGEVVSVEQIKPKDENHVVRADFNRDGILDMAVVREEGANACEVDVFIRKPYSSGQTAGKPNTLFFKGGVIQRLLGTGRIGGIVGSIGEEGSDLTDLILLVVCSNRPNEMIRYRNNGSGFFEAFDTYGTNQIVSLAKPPQD